MQKQEEMIRELLQWWLNTEDGERDLRIQQDFFMQHYEISEQFKQQPPAQQFERFLSFLENLAMQRIGNSHDCALGVKNVMEKGCKFYSSLPLHLRKQLRKCWKRMCENEDLSRILDTSASELEQKKLCNRQAAERQQLYEELWLLEEKLKADEEESLREQLTTARQQFVTASMQLTGRHIAQRKQLGANLLVGGETPAYAEELPITTFVPFGYQLSEHETWIPLMEPTFDAYFANTLKVKKQMCELFGDHSEKLLHHDLDGDFNEWSRKKLREKCGFGKYDDRSFLRILAILVSMGKFRETYGLSLKLAFHFISMCESILDSEHNDLAPELCLIWDYYNPGFKVEDI